MNTRASVRYLRHPNPMPMQDRTHPDPGLTADQRALARGLRDAARIVGHAALPAEHRTAAFIFILPLTTRSARTARTDPRPNEDVLCAR